MENEIKDILYLYLNCEVYIENEIDCSTNGTDPDYDEIAGVIEVGVYKLVGIKSDDNSIIYADVVLLNSNNRTVMCCFDNIKPILRPLSDMTEEELLEATTICYKYVYDHEPEFNYTKVVIEDDENGFVAHEENGKWKFGFTAARNCILFSANGDFLTVPIFDITRYLLSKGFDLFGLIESGKAINKVTI